MFLSHVNIKDDYSDYGGCRIVGFYIIKYPQHREYSLEPLDIEAKERPNQLNHLTLSIVIC